MKSLIALCVLIALLNTANAGELYRCIDRNGNAILTSAPQDGMEKCVLKEGSSEDSSEYSTSGGSDNPTIRQIDKILDELDKKSKGRRGLTKSEREQQTDLLEMKTRLLGGQTNSQYKTLTKMKRKQNEMENKRRHQESRIQGQIMLQEAEIHGALILR